MTGEDFKENIDDSNFDEKEIDNDDLSWLKDFDEDFSNDQVNLDKDFIENVEEELKLKKNNELAEMIGIALGDGSIPKNQNRLRVTLNKSEEPQYTQHVNDLMQKVLNKKPSIYEPKDADAIKLTISSKKLVEDLINNGLKPGDKKVNQVDVPQWIKQNKDYQKDCLRGLVDTDGSIHVHRANESIRIGFKNTSEPLMADFKEMCENNEIKTGKIYPVKGENTYELHIESKKNVVKFINKIEPKKWGFRAETFGLVLKSISNKNKGRSIKKELSGIYSDKRVHYNQEYKEHLKQLCEKHGYDVSRESIIKEITKALTYNENWTNLSKEKIIKLNEKAKRVIEKLEF